MSNQSGKVRLKSTLQQAKVSLTIKPIFLLSQTIQKALLTIDFRYYRKQTERKTNSFDVVKNKKKKYAQTPAVIDR